MNRNRLIIGLAVAILLGFLASNFVYRQFSRVSAAKPVEYRNIVVAAARLPLGTRLQPEQLRLIPWSAGDAPLGMFIRAEDCLNRALITPLEENEPILEAKLAPKEAGGGLPATIPEGMRALSVAVNDVVAVAGFVGPGTMVDVLVTGSLSSGGSGDSVTRTILENVRVLAAGQKIERDKDGKPQTVPVITLLVTPEDAAKLTMASTQGRIQLALRNTVDTKQVNPPPVLQATLFSAAGAAPVKRAASRAAVAPPPPPPPFVVEMIFGSKRETKSFPNP